MKILKPFCLLLALILISNASFAQQTMSVLLSNHTFSAGKPEVGTLHTDFQGNVSFKLGGKDAKKFSLVNDKLVIKSEHIKPDVKWYDITIEAKSESSKMKESFRIVQDQFITNTVVAHRGAWKHTGAAQNSIAALEDAIRLGCQGSEFDVQMSADSIPVVNHDRTFQGVTVATASAKQLGDLKLSNGEGMPTLEAYIKAGLNQNNTKLVLEIKSTTSKERALQLTQKVMQVVRKLKAEAWIDYISFDYDICQELNRLDPYARVAYLNGDKSPSVLAANKFWGLDYHFNVLEKNEHWIDEAKQKGLTINAWTVNDEKKLKWFISKDIDFITTDEPELLLKLIKE
jgi:glycerophosphoryl diester phosphodiesterase